MIASRIVAGEMPAKALQQRLAAASGSALAWLESSSRIIKATDTSRVGLLHMGEEFFYLKLFLAKNPLQKQLFKLGRGRARDSYRAASELSTMGIAVPQPLACLRGVGFMLLLTEGIENATDLNELWLQGLPEDRQLHWITQASELLGDLHRNGYYHGDAKWTNLLCAEGRLVLVDLEAVQSCAPGHARMARDLARFTLNAEDRALSDELFEQFLNGYLQRSGMQREKVLAALKPELDKLRGRHLQQYGPRGRKLF
jgi:tRNA A-37 threonylcarbamoyl transferase component Bud32